MTRLGLTLMLGVTGLLTAAPDFPLSAGKTGTRLDRFLAAMGGRDAWAQVKFIHVEAVHDDLAIQDSFTNKIWNDLTAPRVRFEARNSAMDRRRAIDGPNGWRWRDDNLTAMNPEQVTEDRRWWEANLYRTLHRLAAGDPELSVREVGEHRIEIFLADGRRLNWFVLNARGEPMLFGTWDSEAGTVLGPLASNGTIRYPRWGGRPDGDFRYEIVRIVTAGAVPAGVSFSSP
jgi:hypothetical protein